VSAAADIPRHHHRPVAVLGQFRPRQPRHRSARRPAPQWRPRNPRCGTPDTVEFAKNAPRDAAPRALSVPWRSTGHLVQNPGMRKIWSACAAHGRMTSTAPRKRLPSKPSHGFLSLIASPHALLYHLNAKCLSASHKSNSRSTAPKIRARTSSSSTTTSKDTDGGLRTHRGEILKTEFLDPLDISQYRISGRCAASTHRPARPKTGTLRSGNEKWMRCCVAAFGTCVAASGSLV